MSQKPTPAIAHDEFSALVLREKNALRKIEIAIGITKPDASFRDSLAGFLWRFFLNCSPTARDRFSRAALKSDLRKAAELARKLEATSARLWQSQDAAVLGLHARFGGISVSSPERRHMHPSGVPFVQLLDEYAGDLKRLAGTLPDDPGGRPAAVAFAQLMRSLTEHHAAVIKTREAAKFSMIAWQVTELLRAVEARLTDVDFGLPPHKRALRERLRSIGL